MGQAEVADLSVEPALFELADDGLRGQAVAFGWARRRLRREVDHPEGFVLREPTGTFRLNGAAERALEMRRLAETFALKGSAPNPVEANATIAYTLAEAQPVTLTVYNLLGQKVATLVDEKQEPGAYEVTWDTGQTVSSGVYFYRLTAGDFTATRKMTVVR